MCISIIATLVVSLIVLTLSSNYSTEVTIILIIVIVLIGIGVAIFLYKKIDPKRDIRAFEASVNVVAANNMAVVNPI